MYMYVTIILLYTWNEHNIVNQLYSNKTKIYIKNMTNILYGLCFMCNLIVLFSFFTSLLFGHLFIISTWYG